MFKKKSCKNCGEKVNSKIKFCPECGYPTESSLKKEDYGMLGKNDFPEMNEINNLSNSLFSGFSGKIMNKMLNSAMKMLEKEMQNNMRETQKQNNFTNKPQTNFELYINGKRVNPENIKVSKTPRIIQRTETPKIIQNKFFLGEKKDKFLKFTKESPRTNLKRLSDKIIYEVSLPGVKSIEDISIVKLENSIEIKAISDSEKKSYEKVIPLGMKISNYYLESEKLILELTNKDEATRI